MSDTANGKAAQIAADYFAAWSSRDIEKALTYVSDDVEIAAPSGTFQGHDGYREFMVPFVKRLTGVTEFTVFGDDTTAVAWFDTHSTVVPSLTCGERITLRGDKIARIDDSFDRLPVMQASGKVTINEDTD